MNYPHVFTPINLGSMAVPNRIVMPAMETHLVDEKGYITDDIIAYYVARAMGGPGYVTFENTAVELAGRVNDGMACIYDDSYVPGFQKLVRAVHDVGGRIVIQLSHAGREALSVLTGVESVAPSPIPCPVVRQTPRELTTDEVRELVDQFAACAERVVATGADGVELHMGHGYLLCEFLSAYSNKRSDEYGGSLENRIRFPRQIVEAIRQRVPENYPIICRISADEFVDEGITLNESRVIAQELEKAGATAIHVSACNYTSAFYNIPCYYLPEGCFINLAADIKRVVNLPVIAVGRIRTLALAETVLAEGKADLVSMGRAHIADPEIVTKSKAGREDRVRPCLSCNRCIEKIGTTRIACAVNAEVGRENALLQPAATRKRVLVVGAGPAGVHAALFAARRGHDVTLWEKEARIGGQLNLASLPSCKSPIREWLAYLQKELDESTVELNLGRKATVEGVIAFEPDVVVVATGVRYPVPPIEGLESAKPLTVKEAFARVEELGKNVVVIGGGPEGCEFAEFAAERGKNVTILEMRRKIGMGLTAYERFHLERRLEQFGVEVLTRAQVVRVEGQRIEYQKGKKTGALEGFDVIVCATGSAPENSLAQAIRDQAPDLDAHVIGDASTPRTALEALADAFETAKEI